IAGSKYQIDYTPSLVRGQGYYTGIVFEIASPAFGGAVGGGGRYDNLIGKFIGQPVPAVGFSIGFERICAILLEQNYKIPGAKEKCALLYDEQTEFPAVLEAAAKLRADYSVAILHKAKKMGPMFDMLEKQGYTKFAQFKDGELLIK
ncbi:MAG: ATP phosphoribosyltransferase regulatory subunit, partial [Treponema sp.]|nr:ATP phosphoribosyltransferase regulatory subunit [Treponema sp.]